MRRRSERSAASSVLIVAAVALLCPAPAHAQDRRLDLSPPSRAEIETRLEFLERRLEAAQPAGRLWHYGWLGVYGVGMIANGAQAALADDGDERIAALVGIGKTTIGLTGMLMEPLPARLGADPIRAMPSTTPQEARARLSAAESLLLESAERAARKYTPWPHLSNALLNLAGGGIILAFGKWQDAAISTGLGLVVGEARILTLPDRPLADLAAYEARYGRVPPADTGWHVVPRPNGVALVLRF